MDRFSNRELLPTAVGREFGNTERTRSFRTVMIDYTGHPICFAVGTNLPIHIGPVNEV